MDEKFVSLVVYQKTIVDPNTKVSFPKTLCKYGNKTLDCQIAKSCRLRMDSEMAKLGIKFPVMLSCASSHFFPKKVDYTTKAGENHQKVRIVITDFKEVKQHAFESPDLDKMLADVYGAEFQK